MKKLSYNPTRPFKVDRFRSSVTGTDDFINSNHWAIVISSTVWSIRYNNKKLELHVEFFNKRGYPSHTMYTYFNVPVQVARDLFNCNSIGSFVYQRLRGKGGVNKTTFPCSGRRPKNNL